LGAAQQEGQIVVTADTDFGTLLALGRIAQPSVVLLRRPGRRAEQRAQAVLDAISAVGDALKDGALVVVTTANGFKRLQRNPGVPRSRGVPAGQRPVELSRVRARMLPFDEA
jgi:hypothetical protein